MEKVKYLDGLRGLAALLVVIHHYVLAFYPAFYTGSANNIRTRSAVELWISGTPLNLVSAGPFAIGIFFVLSGYVLSYTFFKDGHYEVIISSAVRRYIRLLFPVLFSVLIAYLFLKLSLFCGYDAALLTTSNWMTRYWNFSPDFLTMLYQGFIGCFFRHEFSYNSVLWTMTYELYGSFIVFGFVALFGNLKRRYVFYAVVVFLLMKTYYVPFVFGMILSDVHSPRHNFLKGKLNGKIIAPLFVVIGLFLGSYPVERTVDHTIYSFMQIDPNIIEPFLLYNVPGTLFIMLAVLNSRGLQSMMSHRVLQYLGRISFSMYLIHLIILFSFSSYLFVHVASTASYGVAFLITFTSSLLLIIAIAHYMYRYVDAKGIQLSHQIYKKLFKNYQPRSS